MKKRRVISPPGPGGTGWVRLTISILRLRNSCMKPSASYTLRKKRLKEWTSKTSKSACPLWMIERMRCSSGRLPVVPDPVSMNFWVTPPPCWPPQFFS